MINDPHQDKHQMKQVGNDVNSEIWECPICHRVVMIQWTPFRRIILEDGDENIDHQYVVNSYDDNAQIISDELSGLLDELDFLSF